MAELFSPSPSLPPTSHPLIGRKGVPIKMETSPYQHPSIGFKGIPVAAAAIPPVSGRPGKRAALPHPAVDELAPKRAKKTTEDAALVAPLPVVAYIKSKTKRKACGRCAECNKPVCGKCKACVLNAKGSEKRRCEALRCLMLPEDDVPVLPIAPPGQESLPTTVEGITAELATNAAQLAGMAAGGQSHDHNSKLAYKMLLARKALLHSAQVSLRNIRSRRKSRFPVGFPEAWGIINKLEKTRVKFADFVVQKSPGNNSAAVERKRQKRDTLDRTIGEYCSLWSEELCPVDDADADTFWKLIGKPRTTMDPSSSEDEEDSSAPSSSSDGSDSE